MQILIVEDDARMSSLLRNAFEEEGYKVTSASDGLTALAHADTTTFDLIVLDVMIPRADGVHVTRALRSAGDHTPIVMLTAKDAEHDVVKGLDAGADDYVVKPFSLEVLLARVRAIGRRSTGSPSTVLRASDLRLDVESHEVRRGGKLICLTPREFSLLELLLRNKGRVLTRQRILDAVWGVDHDVEPNTIEAFIRLLRKKVDDGVARKLIHTVRGIGYSLREND